MEKIQVIQPTKLLAPYIKQYWFLRIDDVKQGFQRSIPAGCVALVFHKGNKIISSFHKGTQPQSYISGQISTYSDIEFSFLDKNANEQLVRTQFLIGAFTGCRHSDYTRLNNRNIVGGMISYVSLKTKTHATVPLKPIVKELLTNLPKEEVSDPTFNNNIRNICRKTGITEAVKIFKAGKEVEGEKWEFVSSHTARRSFATNLYLRGADLYSISQMMGHASVEMTQNYLCCGLREQSAQVMEYFK